MNPNALLSMLVVAVCTGCAVARLSLAALLTLLAGPVLAQIAVTPALPTP